MNKPLHKDPSFWIVAVVSLGFAIWGQWTVAVPWVTTRLQEMKPAERMPVPEEATLPNGRQRRPGFDYSKKTYSWQKPEHDPLAFDQADPQVVIIPSEYTGSGGGGWSTSSDAGAIGIRVGGQQILALAHRWNFWNRLILPPEMDRVATFDFIAKSPENAFEKLKSEAEAKLGLVAERVTVTTNAYILVVQSKEAPGLRPFDPTVPRSPRQESKPGVQTLPGFPVDQLARFIEQSARSPILDRTELTGRFDVDLPQSLFASHQGGQIDELKKLLLEFYGFDLVATNAPVEFLVIRKTAATR